MMEEKLIDVIGNISEEYIEEAAPKKKADRKQFRVVYRAAAACFILFLGLFSILKIMQNKYSIDLLRSSHNTKAYYTNMSPDVRMSYCLEGLTEDELINGRHSGIKTAIVKGIIVDTQNIIINYNGSIDFRAIAEIEVEHVYRGNCAVGDVITVLLPCPIDSDIKVSSTNVVSSMRSGMTGIFMPLQYDENSYSSSNGADLCLFDIAEYGFSDGERYAFLETEEGLIFSKNAYESIKDAASLEEVEQFLLEKMEE